jgi:predicted phosphoribosyltransferase
MFSNRTEAGKELAEKLKKYKALKDLIVLAIPRGGVVVGWEIAKSLKTQMDLVIPRKIGAPHNPELAIGAVMQDGTSILNNELVSRLGVEDEYIKKETENQVEEIRRRLKKYRKSTDDPDIEDKIVILVDDGIATGFTVKAALDYIKRQHPTKIILAVPVMPPDTYEKMVELTDEVVCLKVPQVFFAVGQFYEDFDQVEDEEVIRLMENRHKIQRENR